MSSWSDRNLRLLFIALLLWMLGVALYDQLIPIYARQLGATPVQLGTLFTLRNLMLATGFFVGWMLADRFSRRTVIVVSWIIGVPVPLMLIAAKSYLWLLPGLLLYDLTYFGLPAINAYVTQRVPPSQLASAFSVMGTISSLGFLVSPAIGGLIADRWGIRMVLVIAFVLFFLSSFLIVRLQHGGPGTIPSPGARNLAWTEVRPIVPAIWIYAGMIFVQQITVPYVTPFLREARHLSLSEIGVLGSMQALGAVLLTPIVGRLGDRFGLPTSYGPAALLPLAAAMRCRAPLNALGQAYIGARSPAVMVGRAFALGGILSAALSAAGVFVGGFAYRTNPAYPLLMSVGASVVIAVALVGLRPAASVIAAADA
jgi:DHA1 family multidrug resistance protein-like MFS transporter